MKYRFKHRIEYVLFRGVCAFIGILPYTAALCVACGLARFIYLFLGKKRREAIRRIRFVMGADYLVARARRDAWHSFRNLAFILTEMVYLSRHSTLPRPVEMQDALDRFHAYVAEYPERGGIFACPHTGNWELAGLVAPRCGINMFTIFADQKNPLISAYVRRLRHYDELELLPRGEPNLLRKVLANLRHGKFLAMMPDLRSKAPGVSVHFFGGEANVYPGLGEFARQANVPVFLAIMHREGWSRHVMTLHGPYFPDPQTDKRADAARLLQTTMTQIDQTIRQDPGQWFWFNSRWILDPLPPSSEK